MHDRDQITKKCEFCEELYRSKRASADQDSRDDPTVMTSTIESPSILPSEVEASIRKTKARQSTRRG